MDQSKTVSQLRAIRENIRRVIVGKDEVIDLLLITLIPAWYTEKPALTKLAGVCNLAIGIISLFLLFPALFA